jgi:2TM domain
MDRTEVADSERALEHQARKRVGIKMGFLIHLCVYVLVNLGLLAVNAYTGGTRWAVFPLLGWGLGLAIHGIVTLVSLQGGGIRERMLESEKARLRKKR